ncbi:MAG: hypothetical protein Q8Q59_10195 [Luteolibacter sp.]|nr:hypothetical protein [Luteolibacter sp.]
MRTRSLVASAGVLWAFTVAAVHAAAPPTAIQLSPGTLLETSPAETIVGVLSAVDPDSPGWHFYQLVAGEGSDDNLDFYLYGNEVILRGPVTFDYEVEPNEGWQIRVRATDATGLAFEQSIHIPLANDPNEDVDRDGLTEWLELEYGTSDLLYDSDGDGVGDAAEIAAGTDPLHPDQWPQTSVLGWGRSLNGEQAVPASGEFCMLSTGHTHSLALGTDGEVRAWGGIDWFGQTDVPADLDKVIAVAAGGDSWLDDSAFSLALRHNGTVVAWGYDDEGQLQVPNGLNHVAAIAAGAAHGLALRDNGTVVAWGYNPYGEVEPPADLQDVVAISAGGFQSLALRGDGTVFAWGSTFNGTRWVDATVPAGLCDIIAIAAGRFHCLALKSDGSVVAWGLNSNGQTSVPAGLQEVTAVAAGGFHSLALRNEGEVKGKVVAWGFNSHGQTTVPNAALSGVRIISAGILHSMAVRDGAGYPQISSSPRILSTPGAAISHQVLVSDAGDSELEFSAIGLPQELSLDSGTGLLTGTVDTALRRSVLIQVKTDRGMISQSAWIGVAQGQPASSISLSPASVTENSPAGTVIGTLSAVDPDAGDSHSFEWVDGAGSEDNWRFRIEGDQLLPGPDLDRDYETNAAPFSIRVRARDGSLTPLEQSLTIQFQDDITEDADGDGLTEAEETLLATSDLVYDSDGDGFGDGFEVRRGSLPKNETNVPNGRMVMAWGSGAGAPMVLPVGLQNAVDLSVGGSHSLALTGSGGIIGWGNNDEGQATPPPGLSDAVAVSAGKHHSMALRRNGTLSAWGSNLENQCDVPADLSGVVAVAAGAYHSLALKNDGSVIAWGYDAYGQATVPAGLAGVVAIAAGGFHSLALKSDGTVVAWGSDWHDINVVPVDLDGVVAIAAGGYHSLALRHDGRVVAWGDADHGQTIIPQVVPGVTAIAAGWRHSVALGANGYLTTWGDGADGQTKIPQEAVQIRKISAGEIYNLAIRQSTGFPGFSDISTIRSWPGEAVNKVIAVQNATASAFTAMGLPQGLALTSPAGTISGAVVTGQRRAVRISADTDQGMLSRVFWFNTADGVPPTQITLSGNTIMENAAAGSVVGTLGAVDPNAGDSHVFRLEAGAASADDFRFVIVGDKLKTRAVLNADFDDGDPRLFIRVTAVDAGGNSFVQDFQLLLLDDRTEDADHDGMSEAMEEDVFGTSDLYFDNPNTADADKDGVSGVIEYAFNMNPKVAGPPLRLVAGAQSEVGLPVIDLVAAGPEHQRLRIEYIRRVGSGMRYTAAFASSLDAGNWESAEDRVIISPAGTGWERCVVEDTLTTANAPRRFARVAVVYADESGALDQDVDGITRAMEESVFGTSDLVFDDFRTADLDGDGTPGMIEYAFNLDPKNPGPPLSLVFGQGDTAGLPAMQVARDGLGNPKLRIEYLRRTDGLLTYTPQFASGLSAEDWISVEESQIGKSLIGGGWERCVVEDPMPNPAGGRRFGRVAVSW